MPQAAAYQAKLSANPKNVDKIAVAQDMAAAFGKFGDPSLTVSLANQAALDKGPAKAPNIEVTVETYIAVAFVLVLVLVLIDFNVNEPSGFDKQITPAELRSIADQLINQAKQKHAAGRLADPRATIP